MNGHPVQTNSSAKNNVGTSGKTSESGVVESFEGLPRLITGRGRELLGLAPFVRAQKQNRVCGGSPTV